MYVGVARKFFEIDVLAQGQIARYDKDISAKAYTVAKRGKANEYIVEGDYVEPTTWEIFAPAAIRLSHIQQRRFNILDRTQEKIRIETQVQEDDQFIGALYATAIGNTAVNPITYGSQGSSGSVGLSVSSGSTGVTKTFLNDLISVVMDHDLPCYGLLMRFKQFANLRNWDNTQVDPVTMREVLETGLYGTLWGIDIVVSRRVPNGYVYAIAEPRFFGVMPIRTEFMLMPDDDPKQALIGYVGYEEIGMAIVNANGLALGIV